MQKLLEGRRAAGHIPTPESQLYAPRVIAANGTRVYFNSFESLVSRDNEWVEDAYQWQAAGSGSCTTGSSTYQSSSSGCVDLISSGQSPQGSGFVDSSRDGRDVFFKRTRAWLARTLGSAISTTLGSTEVWRPGGAETDLAKGKPASR